MSARIESLSATLTTIDVAKVSDTEYELVLLSFDGNGVSISGNKHELDMLAFRIHNAIIDVLFPEGL